MEKTASGVPAQEAKQVSQPGSFCMSGTVVELGPGLGVGDALGDGAARTLVFDADCPPHPASAAQAARVRKKTRLERRRSFSFFILGNSFRVAEIDGAAFRAVYRDPE
jgi:hypothetical protein